MGLNRDQRLLVLVESEVSRPIWVVQDQAFGSSITVKDKEN